MRFLILFKGTNWLFVIIVCVTKVQTRSLGDVQPMLILAIGKVTWNGAMIFLLFLPFS